MTMETIARENVAYLEAELKRRTGPGAANHEHMPTLIAQTEKDLAYWRGWVATYDWQAHEPTMEELAAVLGSNWAICRGTPANKARYGNCISKQHYKKIRDDILRKHHNVRR